MLRGKVNANTLNVRAGTGTDHPIVGTLRKNEIISITEEINGWYKIGDRRYVYANYVTIEYSHPVPNGFRRINFKTGVTVFQKDYGASAPDFMLVVDLNFASIRSSLGEITNTQRGHGPLGGDNPLIRRGSITSFSNREALNGDLFAIVNAQFFSTSINPTSLSFPVKDQDTVIADGYDTGRQFTNELVLLKINPATKRARIIPFSRQNLNSPAGETFALGGLLSTADKGRSAQVGRTFVGAKDNLVCVFVTLVANQRHASSMCEQFGFTQFMMLDGGGSSCLMVDRRHLVTNTRQIPHALAIFHG